MWFNTHLIGKQLLWQHMLGKTTFMLINYGSVVHSLGDAVIKRLQDFQGPWG